MQPQNEYDKVVSSTDNQLDDVLIRYKENNFFT